MDQVLVMDPRTKKEIKRFANDVGISIEKAKYIEWMREQYLFWEHDYINELPETE